MFQRLPRPADDLLIFIHGITNRWEGRLTQRITALAGKTGAARNTTQANADMVKRALSGMGPDQDDSMAGLGARMAVNISAQHVPAFCKAGTGEKAYKNAYDLERYPRIGATFEGGVPRRVLVDSVLQAVSGVKPEDIYFGAVELNGSGIRFYGDICLVLQRDKVPDQTTVLSTNSYDLLRPPITPSGGELNEDDLKGPAEKMAGTWGESMPAMAALKTFGVRLVTERRMTTGQISEGILEDEDYLEVLREGTFTSKDLQEVRLSAAEVAAENQISEHLRLGPCPSLAELEWRKRRRSAVTALQSANIHVRVVTTLGRVR